MEISTLRPSVSALINLAAQQASNSTAARALAPEKVPPRLTGFVAAMLEPEDAPMVTRLTVDANNYDREGKVRVVRGQHR